jgi:hypothetical protein
MGAPAGAPARVRVLYILAASHSGSTLLAMLLGGHPDVCTVGELKLSAIGDASRYRCSCGRLIVECGFWRGVEADMRSGGFDFDVREPRTDVRAVPSRYARRLLRPLLRGTLLERGRDAALALSPAWRAWLPRVQARGAALAAAACARMQSRVIVDSSKHGLRLKYLLRNPGVDVRVVRLLRDGRAVTLTYIDPERFADAEDTSLRGGGYGASRDGERLDARTAASNWRRSVEDMGHAFARVPADRRIDLRYEDLCTDVEGSVRRVLAFAGVDPALWQPTFRAREQHVVGNGMRLNASSSVVLDDRWRHALSSADRQVFDAVAGDLNGRLGYA